jgi:hypothetical protein
MNNSDRTEILHHSQLAVGAGSPTALKPANRLNKPALTHPKTPDRIAARSQIERSQSDEFVVRTLVLTIEGLKSSLRTFFIMVIDRT